jgi:LicD family
VRHDAVARSLREVAAVLDTLTPCWFLEGGSCLGFVRGGRAIAWDTDVDIGIYDRAFDMLEIGRRLPVLWYSGMGATITEAVLWLGVRIDVFRYFDYQDRIAAAIAHHARPEVKLLLFPRSVIEGGIQRRPFCGVECNVLTQSHEYCRCVYGHTYMVPDPDYDYWRDPVNAVVPDGSESPSRTPPRPFHRWRPVGLAAAMARSENRLGALELLSGQLRRNRGIAYLATRALIRLLEHGRASRR